MTSHPPSPSPPPGSPPAQSRSVSRLGWAFAALGSVATVTAMLSPGCAGTAAPVLEPQTPQALAPADAPLPAASSSAQPEAPSTDAQPVLADPRLASIAVPIEAGDIAKAAELLAAYLQQPPEPLSSLDRARFSYALGKLHAQNKQPLAASKAFADAARESWVLAPYASLSAALEAQKASLSDDALLLAKAVPDDLPISQAAWFAQAEALEARSANAEAITLYKRYVESSPRPARWVEATLRLGRLLLSPLADPATAEQVVALSRKVLIEQSGGPIGLRAAELEREALERLPEPRKSQLAWRGREFEAARLTALVEAGRYTEAEKPLADLDGSLEDVQRKGELGCKVASAHAKALGKMSAKGAERTKRRAAAAERWGDAIARCSGDARIGALYNGGTAMASISRPVEALARFEQLEREAPTHRLADDARLKGAVAALKIGDEARFSSMLERMADVYPDGDMTTEALFRLALYRIEKGDWAGAVAPLEASIKLRPRERDYQAAGRAPYFLARAMAVTGNKDRARDLYRSVLRDNPLSYYMALAHARLAEVDPKGADAALTEVLSAVDAQSPALIDHPSFHTPGFSRAVELLRQGEADFARSELSALGLTQAQTPPELQWAVASLYAQSGATVLAHNIPRGRVADWLDHYPQNSWRKAWELAYPRPYLDVVTREAKKSGITGALAYAIMREESAFDPQATSSAPAYGLMQFTLDTGKNVGKRLGFAINENALKTPNISIALGCKFLSELRNRYPACPALAIPSYNAGPGRTNAWLTERPYEDFDVFVERIPYDETRNYTKRVLKSYAAYLFLYEPESLSEVLRLPIRAQAKHPEPTRDTDKDEPEPTASQAVEE